MSLRRAGILSMKQRAPSQTALGGNQQPAIMAVTVLLAALPVWRQDPDNHPSKHRPLAGDPNGEQKADIV